MTLKAKVGIGVVIFLALGFIGNTFFSGTSKKCNEPVYAKQALNIALFKNVNGDKDYKIDYSGYGYRLDSNITLLRKLDNGSTICAVRVYNDYVDQAKAKGEDYPVGVVNAFEGNAFHKAVLNEFGNTGTAQLILMGQANRMREINGKTMLYAVTGLESDKVLIEVDPWESWEDHNH